MKTLPQSLPALLSYSDSESIPQSRALPRSNWLTAVNFIFVLFTAKLLVTGVHEGATFFYISKPIDLLFTLAVIASTLLHIDYYIRKLPYPSLLMLALVASFTFTEMLNNGYLIYALFGVLKFIVPFLFLFVLLKGYDTNPELVMGWIKFIVFLIFFLSAVGLALLEREPNRGELFLPPYFLSLHQSAYTLLMAAVAAYFLGVGKLIPFRLALALTLYAVGMIFFGWGVRTAMVSWVVFAVLENFRSDFKKWFAAYVFLTIGVLVMFVTFLLFGAGGFDYEQLVHFSSGRLDMWGLKLGMFSDSTLLEMLFGHGAGSDIVKSDIWWWAAKDSHNDYLRILTENGIFGLTIAVSFLLSIYMAFRQRIFILPLIAMFTATGLFSNGLFFRPVPAQVFMLAIIALVNCERTTTLSSSAKSPASSWK